MINTEKPMKPQAANPDQQDIQATVLAGMRILYNKNMLDLFKQGLEAKGPWSVKLAGQVAGLMKMIDDKSPKGIPAKAVAPAAQLLLLDMVQFIAQIGGPKLSKDVVKEAIPILKKLLIEIFSKHSKGAKQGQQPKGQQPQGQPAPQPTAPQQPAPPQGGLIQQGAM